MNYETVPVTLTIAGIHISHSRADTCKNWWGGGGGGGELIIIFSFLTNLVCRAFLFSLSVVWIHHLVKFY